MLFHLKSGSLIQPRLLLATIYAICTIPGQTGADADPASCPAVTRAAGIPLVAFPSWTTRSSLPVSDSNYWSQTSALPPVATATGPGFSASSSFWSLMWSDVVLALVSTHPPQVAPQQTQHRLSSWLEFSPPGQLHWNLGLHLCLLGLHSSPSS